jgi:hypothetical protein
MFECELCNNIFDTRQHLYQHQSKKNKCNIHTPYSCNKCNKHFKSKNNLNIHLEKNVCKKINVNIEPSESIDFIESIIVAKISEEIKMDILKNKGVNIDKNKLLEIINSDNDIIIKKELIKCFYNKEPNNNPSTMNNSNITNETNSHNNITNNIQINSFGKEDLSYLDKDYFKNLIMNQHIEKGYVQLIKDIYLNKEHPENSTIKVENINNKYALVYDNEKWSTILKYDLREQIHKKNYTILKMHYNKLKNLMSPPKKEETVTFLARDELSDPHMMYVIDKIILLFYNDGEEDELDKNKI